MKIYGYKQQKPISPEIVTDVNGTVIYLNQSAKSILKLKLGDSIGSILDINELRKLSMFAKKMDILKTTHDEYKDAIIAILGEGINKTIKITPIKSYDKTNQDVVNEKNILSVANNIELNKHKGEINLQSFCDDIKNTAASFGNYVNVYTQNDSFYYNQSYLQALVLCSIAMMNETSPNKPVDLYVKIINEKLEVKVIVRKEGKQEIRGAQELKEEFPWCAIRIALIDSICVTNNIEYSMNLMERSLKVVFKIKKLDKNAFSLRTEPIFTSSLQDLYTLLAPRENIALKYDIQVEAQE